MEDGVGLLLEQIERYRVARAANIALASLAGFTIAGDISGSKKYFVEDVVEPNIVAEEGTIQVPRSTSDSAIRSARLRPREASFERP